MFLKMIKAHYQPIFIALINLNLQFRVEPMKHDKQRLYLDQFQPNPEGAQGVLN